MHVLCSGSGGYKCREKGVWFSIAGILTSQYFEVLHEEGGRHHQARAGNEEGEEEVAHILQLIQGVFLLISRAQHDASHKGSKLSGKPLKSKQASIEKTLMQSRLDF